jgi:hypothetical protein
MPKRVVIEKGQEVRGIELLRQPIRNQYLNY